MRILACFLWAVCICLEGYAQNNIVGKVVNTEGDALPYASIVYKQSEEGTSANDKGYFKIESRPDDSLMISMIGYISKTFKLSTYNDTFIFTLSKDYALLDNLELTGLKPATRGFRNVKVGHYKKPFTYFALQAADLEVATYIPNESAVKGIIKAIEFNLKNFQNSNFVLKIRLLRVDSLTGMPGNDIMVDENIIQPEDLKKRMKISLDGKGIELPSDGLYVSLEFLPIDRSITSKTPWIMGNQRLYLNHSYSNYKNLKWIPNRMKGPTSGNYLTQSIRLIVQIPK